MGSFLSQFWRSIVVGLLLPILLLGPGATLTLAQIGDPTTFSGKAAVLRAAVSGHKVVVYDPGPLLSSGSSLQASLLP